MKIGDPKQLLNPYDWLPGYGESKVNFYSDGLDVIVDITYDGIGSDAGEFLSVKRELCFKNVSCLIKLPFPERGVFEFVDDASGLALGVLTEFKKSELLEGRQAGFETERYKHYSIQFLSENLSLHLVAEGYILSEEIPLSVN
ncbi:hypothetical protein [Pseudomonas sp. NPDC089741]|uniref:hypothetical protein n=1 Tax=Pseudomonas sp. NPDC089741 TaxID=3364470 RepID=UPI00382C886B